MKSSNACRALKILVIATILALVGTSASSREIDHTSDAYQWWSGDSDWWSGGYNWWSKGRDWWDRSGDGCDGDDCNYSFGSLSYDSNYDSYRDHSSNSSEYTRPASGVPEPSAALLFMAGGLVVVQGIRVDRRCGSRR